MTFQRYQYTCICALIQFSSSESFNERIQDLQKCTKRHVIVSQQSVVIIHIPLIRIYIGDIARCPHLAIDFYIGFGKPETCLILFFSQLDFSERARIQCGLDYAVYRTFASCFRKLPAFRRPLDISAPMMPPSIISYVKLKQPYSYNPTRNIDTSLGCILCC